MPRRTILKSAGGRVEVDFDGRFSADDFGTLRAFALRGNGFGLLPEFVGERLAAAGRLVRLLPGYATEAAIFYFLAHPQQKFVPQTVRAFIALAAPKTGETRPASGMLARTDEPIKAGCERRPWGWSGRRESNPHQQLGKLPHYHYATPAFA